MSISLNNVLRLIFANHTRNRQFLQNMKIIDQMIEFVEQVVKLLKIYHLYHFYEFLHPIFTEDWKTVLCMDRAIHTCKWYDSIVFYRIWFNMNSILWTKSRKIIWTKIEFVEKQLNWKLQRNGFLRWFQIFSDAFWTIPWIFYLTLNSY